MSRAFPASPSERFHSHPDKLCVVLTVSGLGSQGHGTGSGVASDPWGMLTWGPEKALGAAPAQPHS